MLFVCEISLDGMAEYHNKFRGNDRSFQKAMETYDMLAALQQEDPAPAHPRDLHRHQPEHGGDLAI